MELRWVFVSEFGLWTMTMAIQTDAMVGTAERLAALGHPMRLAVIRELVWAVVIHQGQPPPFSGGFVAALSVAELATRLGMKRAAVGNHLPQMLRSGLVTVVGDAGGDGRKRCLALAATAKVRETNVGREVDFGDVVVRFSATTMTQR